MEVRTYDRQTDGHTDIQRETIIPRHYCVAGYKKEFQSKIKTRMANRVYSDDRFLTIRLIWIYTACTGVLWSARLKGLTKAFVPHVSLSIHARL